MLHFFYMAFLLDSIYTTSSLIKLFKYIKERAVHLMEAIYVEKWKLMNEFSYIFLYLETPFCILLNNEHVDNYIYNKKI